MESWQSTTWAKSRFKMDFIRYLYRKFPNLKRDIIVAHIKVSPLNYIKRALFNGGMVSVLLTILLVFVLNRIFTNLAIPLILSPIASILIGFPLLFLYSFTLFLKAPLVAIKKRRKDIDKDVLFAGRYLLVKINSGKPLLNSLVDASQTYGVGSKYFKEIVDTINLGTPIEEALDKAMTLTPSEHFEKILFQISNSLKIGVDISDTLQGVIEDITADQLTEIEAYSNKLNSVALFYMMLATVVPSLGLTIFVVISVLIGFAVNAQLYLLLWFFVVIIQFFFIGIFKSIRPNINF